ncbi:MAG: sugar ABC transporter substrate-binding protein [Armatimonadetes bacterium]|nr:sugar ABC transporter substrate-binding protein [Armatimonadota bacterium]
MGVCRGQLRGNLGAFAGRPLAFAPVLLAAVLWGCRAGQVAQPGAAGVDPAVSASPSRAVIRYAYWAVNRHETQLLQELKAAFEKRNPGAQVQLLGVSERYYEKLQTMIASGEAPDAFSVNYGRLADFVRAGTVRDLSKFVAADPALEKGCLSAAWASTKALAKAIRRPGLWGLPKDWPPAGLVLYNRDLLAAAGVRPPTTENPWTWRDFEKACRAVAAARLPDVYPTALNLYPYTLFTWIAQAGGSVVGEDGSIRAAEPAVAEAIQFVLGLWRSGLAPRPSPGHDNSFELFTAGRVALLVASFYNVQSCRELRGIDWGVGPPLQHRRWACSGLPTYVAIAAASSNPRQAWAWARFLTTEGALSYAAECITVPAWRPALSPEVFLATPPLSRARDAVMAALRLTQPPPLHPDLPYELIADEMRTAVEQAIARGLDGPATARRLAERLVQAQREKLSRSPRR